MIECSNFLSRTIELDHEPRRSVDTATGRAQER